MTEVIVPVDRLNQLLRLIVEDEPKPAGLSAAEDAAWERMAAEVAAQPDAVWDTGNEQ